MDRTNMFTLHSQQRSGIHFVASLLSSHSGIRVYGAVLHRRSANSYLAFQGNSASGRARPSRGRARGIGSSATSLHATQACGPV